MGNFVFFVILDVYFFYDNVYVGNFSYFCLSKALMMFLRKKCIFSMFHIGMWRLRIIGRTLLFFTLPQYGRRRDLKVAPDTYQG